MSALAGLSPKLSLLWLILRDQFSFLEGSKNQMQRPTLCHLWVPWLCYPSLWQGTSLILQPYMHKLQPSHLLKNAWGQKIVGPINNLWMRKATDIMRRPNITETFGCGVQLTGHRAPLDWVNRYHVKRVMGSDYIVWQWKTKCTEWWNPTSFSTPKRGVKNKRIMKIDKTQFFSQDSPMLAPWSAWSVND
jgi:hypothetical protein